MTGDSDRGTCDDCGKTTDRVIVRLGFWRDGKAPRLCNQCLDKRLPLDKMRRKDER